jgi:hypothetical protein
MIHALGAKIKTFVLRKRVRYLTRREWDKWHRDVFALRPEYAKPCPKSSEKEHLRLWRPLRPDVSLDTLRICYNISGVADPHMIPEEIWQSELESVLNRYDFCNFLANKSFSNRWFPGGLFPQVFLHNIDGTFYTGDYEPVDGAEVDALLRGMDYPVVFKPSMGSGGRGVCFPDSPEALRERMAAQRNFVVQRKIRQHPFFSRFNSHGLNTLRVCLYRSVVDNQVHFLNAALRMGVGGSLDNLTQGGIVRYVHEDGRLNHYAVDTHGLRFDRHPDSGLDFSVREVVPRFEELRQIARRAADCVYLTRVVSFDFCLDEAGQWRAIEVNLKNQTIQFPQYAGHPFFGRFTHEVVEYCREHPRWTVTFPP